MQQVSGGVTTHFVLDLNNSLSQVLSDGSSTYLYGLDRIAKQNIVGRRYYLGDALGSVRQLVNPVDAVIQARSYEPFGKQLSIAGNLLSKYAFTGEQQDPTGLIYLRARYYDPTTGRFISKDPYVGMITLPITLSPYTYSLNNPIRYTDPTGMSAKGGINIPSSIYSYLSPCSTEEGECNVLGAIVGTGLIIFGGVVFTVGVLATKAAILSLQIEFAGLTALAAVSGGGLAAVGGLIWIKSGCLPEIRR